MPLGFLEGLISKAGEQMETRRAQNRDDAERKYKQQMDILEGTVAGKYGVPTKRTLSEALQGIAELSEGPKKKKGFKAHMTGEMEDLVPMLLQRIGSDDTPLWEEGSETGVPYPGTPGISEGPGAPGQGGPPGAPGGVGRAVPPELPPPPTSQAQPVGGAPEGMQRYEHTPEPTPPPEFGQKPMPAATQTQSRLGGAAMSAAGLMQAGAEPLATPEQLPTPPNEGDGLFKSPQMQAQEAADLAQAKTMADAGNLDAAYSFFKEKGYDDSQIRSLMSLTQDPARQQQAQSPFASANPVTFVNPEDPSQQGSFFVYKDGGVRSVDGQPLPPGWIEREGSQTGGRPRLDLFTDANGVTTVANLDAIYTGQGVQGTQVPSEYGLPTSMPVTSAQRAIPREPNEAAVVAAKQMALDTRELSDKMTGFFAMDAEEEAAWKQSKAEERGYGSWAEYENAAVQVPTQPQQGAVAEPPPPLGGRRERTLQEIADDPKAKDDDELIAKWMKLKGGADWVGGIDFMQSLGLSPAELAEEAQDPDTRDWIISQIMQAIYESPTGR